MSSKDLTSIYDIGAVQLLGKGAIAASVVLGSLIIGEYIKSSSAEAACFNALAAGRQDGEKIQYSAETTGLWGEPATCQLVVE